jgi:hypothetical protein
LSLEIASLRCAAILTTGFEEWYIARKDYKTKISLRKHDLTIKFDRDAEFTRSTDYRHKQIELKRETVIRQSLFSGEASSIWVIKGP